MTGKTIFFFVVACALGYFFFGRGRVIGNKSLTITQTMEIDGAQTGTRVWYLQRDRFKVVSTGTIKIMGKELSPESEITWTRKKVGVCSKGIKGESCRSMSARKFSDAISSVTKGSLEIFFGGIGGGTRIKSVKPLSSGEHRTIHGFKCQLSKFETKAETKSQVAILKARSVSNTEVITELCMLQNIPTVDKQARLALTKLVDNMTAQWGRDKIISRPDGIPVSYKTKEVSRSRLIDFAGIPKEYLKKKMKKETSNTSSATYATSISSKRISPSRFLIPKDYRIRKKRKADPAERADRQGAEIQKSLQMYRIHNSQYPPSLDDLVKNVFGADRWRGPYIEGAELLDPWGERWRYSSRNNRMQFSSAGEDSVFGTQDDLNFPK